MPKEDDQAIARLAIQLEKTNALLTALVRLELEDLESTKGKKIELLSNLGFAPSEIARIMGITSANVRVQLHMMRSRRSKVAAEEEETTETTIGENSTS